MIAVAALLIAACTKTDGGAAAQLTDGSTGGAMATGSSSAAPATPATAATRAATGAQGQRGEGMPYEISGSEVWDVPDPASGRDYQVFVALPPSYASQPGRRYPVLYATDADYAFPLLRSIGRRLNVEGPAIDEFILVGLSYASGEDSMASRRRDYTPTTRRDPDTPAGAEHGGGSAYIAYLRDHVIPFVASRYRSDEGRRMLLGHSYGALLGAQILLSEPSMFSGYILGSPSFWYDDKVIEGIEERFARENNDLDASVYVYVGEQEARAFGKRYDMVSDAQRMEQALGSRGYPSLRMRLEVLDGEDHLSVAPRGFTHGLKHLMGRH